MAEKTKSASDKHHSQKSASRSALTGKFDPNKVRRTEIYVDTDLIGVRRKGRIVTGFTNGKLTFGDAKKK